MRLIDADELKKCAIPCDIHNGTLTDLCVPLYQIDNAPTVEITEEQAIDKLHETGWLPRHDKEMTARPTGEWISASERLPEQANQSYLVTVDYGNGLICACQRFFFNSEIGWNDDCVIAWQPLPEPYEKGGKE